MEKLWDKLSYLNNKIPNLELRRFVKVGVSDTDSEFCMIRIFLGQRRVNNLVIDIRKKDIGKE
jgi:hypothetical protein